MNNKHRLLKEISSKVVHKLNEQQSSKTDPNWSNIERVTRFVVGEIKTIRDEVMNPKKVEDVKERVRYRKERVGVAEDCMMDMEQLFKDITGKVPTVESQSGKHIDAVYNIVRSKLGSLDQAKKTKMNSTSRAVLNNLETILY